MVMRWLSVEAGDINGQACPRDKNWQFSHAPGNLTACLRHVLLSKGCVRRSALCALHYVMKRTRVQSRQDFLRMQPRPPLDRALLIPLAIGVVSLLGIGWILLTSDLGQSLIRPTATPSSVSFLEAGTLTPSPRATRTREKPPPTATATSPNSYPGPAAETLPSTGTQITES